MLTCFTGVEEVRGVRLGSDHRAQKQGERLWSLVVSHERPSFILTYWLKCLRETALMNENRLQWLRGRWQESTLLLYSPLLKLLVEFY